MTTPIPGQTEAPYFLDLLEVDFRAEILAAALSKDADLGSRVIVNPTGMHNRTYSKDINEVRFWYPNHSDQPYQRIDTPREGLFDMMPQYLFVEPRSPDVAKDTDRVLADIRVDRQLEEDARQFFRPFDVELNHLRTLAVHYDDAVDRLDDARAIIDQFTLQWPILNRMTPTEAGLFCRYCPIFTSFGAIFIGLRACWSGFSTYPFTLVQVDTCAVLYIPITARRWPIAAWVSIR